MSLESLKNLAKVLVVFFVFLGIFSCKSKNETVHTQVPDEAIGEATAGAIFTEHYVPSQGDSIFVKTVGEGAPILVIHGGPGLDHTYFLPHLLQLADDHQLIFYDQRASGRSSIEVDSNTISIDGFLFDIENIRNFLGISQWSILGHSWGGYLTLCYALTYPEALDQLVLVDPMPGSTELQEESQLIQKSRETASDSIATTTIMQSSSFKNGEVSAYEELFRALFANQFYDRIYVDSLVISFQPSFLEGSKKLRYLAKDISAFDIHSQLESMAVPTLLIYGAHDPLSGNSAEMYARYIPNVQLVIIPHSGHFPFVEQKEAFFAAVDKFLQHESL